MLRRILDEGLRPDVHVLFADTGQEFPQTYQFVDDVKRAWGVSIATVHRPGYFTQLITDKKFLPNPVMRFCTTELKLKPINDWMYARGHKEWETVVGIRADEPKRVAIMRERGLCIPLAEAGVTVEDVMAFWGHQPFDLQLRPHESNCDLCFLKGARLRQQIMRDHPETADWWIEQERRIGARFRVDAPSYATLRAQRDLFEDTGSLAECYCHD